MADSLNGGQMLDGTYVSECWVYTGTPMWNECLEQCNDIINSGLFSLETNYTDIFKTENSGCVETIFAIPYDEVYNEGTTMVLFWSPHEISIFKQS